MLRGRRLDTQFWSGLDAWTVGEWEREEARAGQPGGIMFSFSFSFMYGVGGAGRGESEGHPGPLPVEE